MSRRGDRTRRRDRRQRNAERRDGMLVPRDGEDDVVRLRRRVVLRDRGGLILDITFAARLETGMLGVPFVRAEAVAVTVDGGSR